MRNKIIIYGASFGVQFVITLLITFLTVQYYASKIAAEMFYNLNIVKFLVLFASLGIPQALIRFQYIKDINKKDLNQSVAIVGLYSLIFGLSVTFFIADFKAMILVLLLPFTVSQYYLRSKEEFKSFTWLHLARLTLIILGAGIIFFTKTPEIIWWYIIVGGSCISGIISYPPLGNFRVNKKLLKSLLSYSVPLQFYTFLLQGVFIFGQFVLKKFGSTSDFEEYVMTLRLIQILQAISALVFFFYPQFYFKKITEIPQKVIRIQQYIIFGLIVISVLVVCFKPLWDILFKFQFDYLILIILLLSEIIRLSAGLINTKFSYYMKNKVLLYSLLVSVVAMLIYLFGIYIYENSLNILNISLGLFGCFSIYFLITFSQSRKLN